jgi:galactokinase/mevalonate kinase-like predicted kinase
MTKNDCSGIRNTSELLRRRPESNANQCPIDIANLTSRTALLVYLPPLARIPMIESHAISLRNDVALGVTGASFPTIKDTFPGTWRCKLNRQDSADFETEAFAGLRSMIIGAAQLSPAIPHLDVKDDQIIWASSPIRFDLAGGWTDTPPYCIEHGGKVVNLAADLNGRAPIQVYAKVSAKPEIVLRSIDLGLEERVRSYQELDRFARPDCTFAVAKAALALAGFLPRFYARSGCDSLREQLEDFGGGFELSFLAAVPKGSGLGTSSILAASILSVLSELCGLCWTQDMLFTRTLALEQMVTTGGGWQDQAGALYSGVKLLETGPGLAQKPSVRRLPVKLFGHDYANKLILLYYTGITRVAKSILAEIVRRLFLGSESDLAIISQIGVNADLAYKAVQRCDYDTLLSTIRASWLLNQMLDCGTNPPEVRRILEPVQDFLGAAKLLGAGGGGYLLLLAKDNDAATKIRTILTDRPPNNRARFVDFSLSESGTQMTRS